LGQAGLNPGGIGGLGSGFTQPTNGLQATSPLGVLGATTIVGTAQFSLQVSLAEKKGVANIQARPFGTVTDGSTIDLIAGSQIPVVTTAIGGGALVQTGNVQFLEASRVLRITPQVAEDDQGNPTFVTLQVQLENNAVDTSLPAFGGLPALARQSLQTTIRLADGQTGLIGGLAADSVSKATSKVPGLGEVPVVGHLFKRTTDQVDRNKLYFAITARVIPMDAPLSGAEMPSDATTSLPAPPPPQKSIK
jgi:type II secretory pathway component GspD/PulD (secretin)